MTSSLIRGKTPYPFSIDTLPGQYFHPDQAEDLQEDLPHLATVTGRTPDELSTLLSPLSDQKAVVGLLKTKVIRLFKEVEDRQKELINQEKIPQEISRLERNISLLEQQIQEIEAQMQSCDLQLTAALKTKQEAEKTFQSIHSNCPTAKQALQKWKIKHEEALRKKSTAQNTYLLLQKKQQELERQITPLKTKKSNIQEKLEELERQPDSSVSEQDSFFRLKDKLKETDAQYQEAQNTLFTQIEQLVTRTFPDKSVSAQQAISKQIFDLPIFNPAPPLL